tara:strand:+ start:439 stop:1230 length:792 start_codon:yes stop_codon:yes gene_type:complete
MKRKILKILNRKFKKPISCLTAYSSSIAKIIDGKVDIVLVGDSLGTTLYGMKNTRGVTIEMMKSHGKAVSKNITKSMFMIDMPYKTYTTKFEALKNAKKLLKYTKAKILKLEINNNNIQIIKYLSEKKISTVAHIGVTPQSFSNFNKIRTVGKKKLESNKLLNLAIEVEKAGADGILLECVSLKTAREITNTVSIPTIGIGSSKYCDGQILVFDDLIKVDENQSYPRFVKNYMNFGKDARKAVNKFNREIKGGKYPNKKYTYY